MTKLSKSVNKNEDNKDQNKEIDQSQTSLTKKIEKQQIENSTENLNGNGTISQSVVNTEQKQVFNTVASVEDVSEWLVNLIGDDVFNQLKNNPFLQLPYTSDDITLKEWLQKAIKTIFTQENIQRIATQININQNKIKELQDKAEKADNLSNEIEEKYKKYDEKFKELKEQIDEAEDSKFKIQSELNTAVPLSKLIIEFYRDPEDSSEELKKIIAALNEAIENKSEEVSRFILRFSKGWFYLKSTLMQLTEDEKENLEKVHSALAILLHYVSNQYVPERRPLLDLVAAICSKYFEGYDFISPEQTLQIDPEIHNAQGLGSVMIKEGITFAVVRKQTRKAVKYADVRVA